LPSAQWGLTSIDLCRLFVGSNDGRVYGLDLASGKKVWEYEAASPVTSSPAVAKGKVVVATADGQVICFG
jgi:outer membrane protein assembly factor BamB